MPYFETLSGLGAHLAGTGIEVVDPGLPLRDWAEDLRSNGPAWDNQPSVRKVVGFIARNVASLPVNEYERRGPQDRVKVRDSPLAQLLRRPSRAPGMTAYRFWESFLIDGLLHDKAVARIMPLDDGSFELVRIPARLVKLSSTYLDTIDKVQIRNRNAEWIDFDPADFLIDVGYSARGAGGTSPLKTMRDILDESREAVAYRRSVWANGGRHSGYWSHATTFTTDESRNRFTNGMRRYQLGGGSEGGTPVVENGITWKPADSFRPRDTNDLEGRQLTDVEVSSAYHVAPELTGAREGNFASVKAFQQMLFGPALGPYIVAWEQMLDATLVPLLAASPTNYVEANVEAKLRGSFEEQAGVLSTSVGAPWMTRNEVRARQNLPAVDGGDELITPLNVLVGGQASPQDGKTADPATKTADPTEGTA
jgi:HK97 family phage portal protein